MTWFRWFRKEKPMQQARLDDTSGLTGEVRQAMQKHASSSRLLQLRAIKNLKAFQALNETLALRATAREGIRAADLALKAMDKARNDNRS